MVASIHWVNWWKCKMVLSLGKGFTRHVIRKMRKNPRYWTGGFSNMGDWSPTGGPDDVVAWVGIGAVRRDMAINCTVLIFRGRMAASITIHPGIADNVKKMQECLDRWKTLLLQMPKGSASTASATPPQEAALAQTGEP